MKLFLSYLKSKTKVIVLFASIIIVFNITFLLFRLPYNTVLYPELLSVLILLVATVSDYTHFKNKHDTLLNLTKQSIAKICDLPVSSNPNEKLYQDLINILKAEIAYSENEHVDKIRNMNDYYSVWAHQIKTPIASMKLSLQNEDSDFARKLSTDLFRIEQYVEMVLAFLRLDSSSNDYLFKSYDLDTVLRQSVRKFAPDFITKKISLQYEPLKKSIVTDEKWFSFVIEQILSNSLKYTRSGSVKIYMNDENRLCISDTGIGIAPEDIPRIFENGYTGLNGRIDKSASGIGLYLCKRICDNLGIDIKAESELDKGTTISLDIEQNDYKKE